MRVLSLTPRDSNSVRKCSIDAICRLAIVDLSPLGRQPMESSDGRLVLTYNGEIYNHRELRGELEAAGIRRRSPAHTQGLVEAWCPGGGARGGGGLGGVLALPPRGRGGGGAAVGRAPGGAK